MDLFAYTLTDDQEKAWIEAYPDEYAQYVNEGLYDPETNQLFEVPDWMNNGDYSDGPFDFALAPSHNTIGW